MKKDGSVKRNGHVAKGWEMLHDKRREERRQMLLLIEERGPALLDGEPKELFHRSIVPVVISVGD